MKKIEAIIHPSKIEEVKHALTKIGMRHMRISKVDEFGSQKGRKEIYRGETYILDTVHEFRIELIVDTDEMLNRVIETIYKATETENSVGGEVFISPVEEGSRFRHPSNRA